MKCEATSGLPLSGNPLLSAALNYAAQGLPIFPCNSDKRPLISNGFKGASTDPGQVTTWWTQHPEALIGMPTGQTTKRVVIDLDVKNGKDGISRWRELQLAHNATPMNTLVMRTASGGEHWHFVWPGVKTKSTADKIAQGIDTRADGGYVIMPPSTDSRGRYTVLAEAPVAPIPPWLMVEFQNHGIIGNPDKQKTTFLDQSPLTAPPADNDTDRRIGRALQMIDSDSSYEDWLTVGMALHAWNETKGLELWDAWSRKGWNYKEGEPEEKWSSFDKKDGGVTLGTLFHMANACELASMHEPTPLPAIASVAPFSYDMLPSSIAPWVEDIVDRMQCQPDIVAVPAVVAMAVLVGRKVAIRPKRHDDWTEVPTLWGAAIGRPGTLKTPAISEAMTPLRRIEHEETERFQRAAENHETQMASWQTQTDAAMPEIKAALKSGDAAKAEELKKQLPPEPSEPGRTRLIVNDTTVEALGEILRTNPNGVLMFRDELTGWLRSLEKDNQRDARAFYLEAWNGKNRFVTDRIGRGTVEIECAIVSIMGGIQPGPLQAYMADLDGRGDDGLLQRFQLIVWPEPKTGWRNVDRYPDITAKNTAFAVYERLHDLTPQSVLATMEDGAIPYLRFCDDAQGIFNDWRARLEEKLAEGTMSDAMQAHLAKYRKLVPVLALLFHLADGGKCCVGAAALNRALAWARYLESHAGRLYGSKRNAPANLAAALLEKITCGALTDGFTVRDIYRHQWTNLVDPKQVQDTVNILIEHGYLLEQSRREGGRPCKVYRINPHIRGIALSKPLTELTEVENQGIVLEAKGSSVSSDSRIPDKTSHGEDGLFNPLLQDQLTKLPERPLSVDTPIDNQKEDGMTDPCEYVCFGTFDLNERECQECNQRGPCTTKLESLVQTSTAKDSTDEWKRQRA